MSVSRVPGATGAPEDAEAYAHARWADAVRALVALGAEVPEAEAAARTAWARTWGTWRREHRDGDVDVLVFGELLRVWGWPRTRPGLAADEVARALVGQARLSEHAAERLTGVDPGGGSLAPGAAGWGSGDDEDAYRSTAPIAAILAERARRRRRTTGLVAAAALLVAAVVGVVLALGRGPETPDRPEVANPLPLAWWSQGTLHLGRSEVAVPGLLALAQAGSGKSYAVVVGDASGEVLQVDDATDPVPIGRWRVGSSIGASPDGRAAWVDVSGPVPAVVVWDTAAGEVIGRLVLADVSTGLQTEVVALDGDTVYLRSPAGTSRWVLGGAGVVPVLQRVLDASEGTVLTAIPPADTGTSLLSGPEGFRVAADHQATLSPGGLVAAAWVPGEPGLTLAGAGANLTAVPLRLPPHDGIVDARFAPDGALVLLLRNDLGAPGQSWGGPAGERPAPLSLVACALPTGACRSAAALDDPGVRSAAGPPVVLAR